MHELALMDSLVETVKRHVGDARVKLVCLEVGKLSGVAPDALRFCFDVCARATALEGARLEIVEVGGHARCRACGNDWAAVLCDHAVCICGSVDVELIAGRELRIREVEVI